MRVLLETADVLVEVVRCVEAAFADITTMRLEVQLTVLALLRSLMYRELVKA